MRIVVFVLIGLFAMMNAYGAEVPTRVSGATVTFDTVGTCVTFNSVTKRIFIRNESNIDDCYVDLIGRDSAGKRGNISLSKAVVKAPSAGSTTPNWVIVDFATKNLVFIAPSVNGGGHAHYDSITYFVTGDEGVL